MYLYLIYFSSEKADSIILYEKIGKMNILNIYCMFIIIGLVFVALWFIAFIGFHVIGWLIHILLIISVIMILVGIIRK
jgi:hypothetical protein